MDCVFDNFRVNGGLPYAYWKIKNHEEMKEWLLKTSKYRIPKEFFDLLVQKEMENLICLKLQTLKSKA